MRQDTAAQPVSRPASPAQRKAIHDLRNLFAIIGAAKGLLERDPNSTRREELLTAIGEATRQGGQLTTQLLANCAEQASPVLFDVLDRLARLAPMFRVLADTEINLAQACRSAQLFIRAVPADFDAALLELVSNAAAAGASSVTVRSRLCGGEVWLLVSDNGSGMSASTLQRARRGHDLGLAHGSGLARVRQFMTANGGRMLIRSSRGAGTCFALIFPVAGSVTSARALHSAFPAFNITKALSHAEIRHTVAA